MNSISLTGAWRYETDPEDTGRARKLYTRPLTQEGFHLPGSACENQVGHPFRASEHTFREIIRSPHERYEYIGPMWLQREVELPDLGEHQLALYLERVNMASELWVDGEPVGRQIISLSTPHTYLLPPLQAGTHTLTLRLDNRPLVTNGTWASGYSVDTQGYWIGVAGRVELQVLPRWRVERLGAYPTENGMDVELFVYTDIHQPGTLLPGMVTLRVTEPDGTPLPPVSMPVTLFTRQQRMRLHVTLPRVIPWNEFSPSRYSLAVTLEAGGHICQGSCRFGLRRPHVEQARLFLNDRQLALRGTIDCAQFPLTGYPPTDKAAWLSRMNTLKSWGLNHVRFHAWCPPEAAFEAADETGMYLQIEMPLWLNQEIGEPELGDDPIHRPFYMQEALSIIKRYGQHPSFLLFSCGNETMGDFELLDDILRMLKAIDPRHLYTLTSNYDHPVQPSEDYFSALSTTGLPLRIQHLHDRVSQATDADFSQSIASTPVPILTFEVGQYCLTPDVRIIEDYTGAMEPCNFEWIRQQMAARGVLPLLPEYLAASGNLAVKMYKEDIEAVLRTEALGGFQLLALSDYTGQSTACVGLLDVMLRSKGVCTPEMFRCFCDCVVPLFKARRIFSNEETLEADLQLYDHGPTPIAEPSYEIRITRNGRPFWQTRTTVPHISVPLASIDRASRLEVTVTVAGHSNHWQVYVFPPVEAVEAIPVLRTPEELSRAKQTGGRYLALASCFQETAPGGFIPVFWSPVHFPSVSPCGMMIDAAHPALACFPTERYPDYQWKQLLEKSRNITLPDGIQPIMEAVPNFTDSTRRSPLFEARMGKAQVLVCGFDLDQPDLPTRQLKASLFQYMSSHS